MGSSLQWTPSIAVGHPEIDGQHRELFERASRFFDAANAKGPGEADFTTAFLYLDSYVRFHFAQEERLMRRLGYPGVADHQAEHRIYVQRLDSVKSQFESEGDSVAATAALDGLLVLWLTEHISRADKALGEFAASNGT